MKQHALIFEALLIFLLGLAVFTCGLFDHEFIQFESRFGLFAQEMLRNGISFFPTTYGKYYPDYPATQTILTYLFSLLPGKVTILTAILPTALASSFTLMFIYLTGALHNKYWGIYAVLFALFTFNFLSSARTISLDQFTTAATAACFYVAYSTKMHRATYSISQQRWRNILIPLIWVISFAFRGPIGFIIPAVIIGIYYLIEKDWRHFVYLLSCGIPLFLLCMAALLSAAWYEGGYSFVQTVIHMQVVNRLNSTASVPFYYYFTASFIYYALSFPVAIAVFAMYSKQFLQTEISAEIRLLRYLAIWLLIILFGMSIPSDEKMRYILPITPAIALGAAYLYYARHAHKYLYYLRCIINMLCVAVPFIGLFAIVGCIFFSRYFSLSLGLSYSLLFFLSITTIILEIILSKKIHQPDKRELAFFCLGAATFIILYSYVAQPIDVQVNRAKPFANAIETLRTDKQAIIFYRIGPDGEDIKFMVALDKPLQPLFLQTPQEIGGFSKPAIFIAKTTDFAALPENIKQKIKILYRGRLGHQDCVAFKIML